MIKGISDIRRLRRVGKLHLGVKTKSARGSEFPKAVDYFVCKASENTPLPVVEAFKAVYGDNPRELKVLFPANDLEVFFQQWYKAYVRTQAGKGKLICKGDGADASRLNLDTGEMEEIPCLGPESCPHAQPSRPGGAMKCRQIGSLQFLLPDVPIIGVWQIDTSSFNGIVTLNSDIDLIKTLTSPTGAIEDGRVAMVPLTLKIVAKMANIGEGKTKNIFHLTAEFKGRIQDLQSKYLAGRPIQAPAVPQIDHEEVPENHFPEAVAPDGPPPLDNEPQGQPESVPPSSEPIEAETVPEDYGDAQEPPEDLPPAPVVRKSQPKAPETIDDLIAAEFKRLKYAPAKIRGISSGRDTQKQKEGLLALLRSAK